MIKIHNVIQNRERMPKITEIEKYGQNFSSFDDSDGPQFDGFSADASGMTSIDHISDVFIRFRGFFHNQFGRGHAYGDSLG